MNNGLVVVKLSILFHGEIIIFLETEFCVC